MGSRESVRTDIKVLYCFHQNNDDSKYEVAHTPLPVRPLKVQQSQEGYMAPKPARFVFSVGMALTILAVMTWAVAALSESPIYQPQLLLLY